MSNYTETRVNVTLGGGKAVHTGLRVTSNGSTYAASPECGGNRASERYRETNLEVTCKRCLKLLAELAEAEAAYQDRLEASMMPADEARDLGYVAEADAADAQPADVVAVREDARDAAEDARRDAALIRASLKLSAPSGVPADQATLDAQRVRDAAHAEALAFLDQVSIPDAEDLRRDLEAVVKARELCTCGHGKHSYGPCYGLSECEVDCAEYVPSGLEGVYDPRTDVWGVRVIGTQVATWLTWMPSRGSISRNARAALARQMAGGNA